MELKKEKVRGSFNLMKMYYLNSDCLKCIPLLEICAVNLEWHIQYLEFHIQ